MEITNAKLQSKRSFIFKKVEDLFYELVCNKKLEISDEITLLIPIDVNYKSRLFELKMELDNIV
jgi:vesicle coat complex subunit